MVPTGRNVGNKMTGMNDIIPKGYRMGQVQQFSPEQMQLFQQMFGHVGPNSFLSRLAGGDQSQFEELEAPAMRQFQGLQGQLASRFSGFGMGGRRSSGFQNSMNQATSDFAQDLQAQRMGLQRQAIQDLQGMSGMLFNQKPFERQLIKKQMPFWKQLLLGMNEKGQEMAGEFGKVAAGMMF